MVLPAPDLENEISNSVNKLQKLYPGELDAKKYLYFPHGKYAFAAKHTFHGKNKKQIGRCSSQVIFGLQLKFKSRTSLRMWIPYKRSKWRYCWA
jgi:hypothetical protein